MENDRALNTSGINGPFPPGVADVPGNLQQPHALSDRC